MKKGSMGMLIIVVGVVISLTILMISSTSTDNLQSNYIGETQLSLLETVQLSENALLYIDISARYAFEESFYRLSSNGGFIKDSECGKFNGINLWNNYEKDCFPEDLNFKLSSMMGPKLNRYLSNSDIASPPLYEFIYVYQDNNLNLISKARDDLKISFGKPFGFFKNEYIPSDTFIDEYLASKSSPLAGIGSCLLEMEEKTKIPWSVALSQAILESGWGKSSLANEESKLDGTLAKNLFGYKCTESNKGTKGCSLRETHECYSDEEIEKNKDKIIDCNQVKYNCKDKKSCLIKDSFKAYENWCDSIMDYADLISTAKRYENVMNYVDDPERMFIEIYNAGYSTDSEYVEKLTKIHSDIVGDTQGNKITAAAVLALNQTSKKFSGLYRIIPNSKVQVFDFIKEFTLLKKNAQDMINECSKSLEKVECVKTQSFNLKWGCLKNENDMFSFCHNDSMNTTYNFALTLVDVKPPIVENFKVEDFLNSEKGVKVSFDKSKASDVNSYNLYIEDTLVKLSNPLQFENNFELDSFYSIGNSLVYIPSVNLGKKYSFYMTAVDDNKQISDKSKVITFAPIDDLYPKKAEVSYSTDKLNLILPFENIDLTPIFESNLKVNIYYSDDCNNLFLRNPLIIKGKPGDTVEIEVPTANCYGVFVQGSENKPSDLLQYSEVLQLDT